MENYNNTVLDSAELDIIKDKLYSYLDDKNQFISNGLSNRIAHVDDLPRPAWDLCNIENFKQRSSRSHLQSLVSFL